MARDRARRRRSRGLHARRPDPDSTEAGDRPGDAEVAEYLGNTPTVARASYVDSRIIDLFEDG